MCFLPALLRAPLQLPTESKDGSSRAKVLWLEQRRPRRDQDSSQRARRTSSRRIDLQAHSDGGRPAQTNCCKCSSSSSGRIALTLSSPIARGKGRGEGEGQGGVTDGRESGGGGQRGGALGETRGNGRGGGDPACDAVSRQDRGPAKLSRCGVLCVLCLRRLPRGANALRLCSEEGTEAGAS